MKRRNSILAAAAMCSAAFFVAAVYFGAAVLGSDHADTPNLIAVSRHDARITDLYAFRDGDDLVMILGVDPTVPPGVTEYHFQPDAIYEFNIDRTSTVSFDDAEANSHLGGTIDKPDNINADIAFRVTFQEGVPSLRVRGIKKGEQITEMFTGLRDDPFIRGPRIGRNVAAIVLKVPLEAVLGDHPELLIWAWSRVPEIDKPEADQVGMALRTMFAENMPMNEMPPRMHKKKMGVAPDVIIYDTSQQAGFPNGRLLTDDVVDLVGDMRVLGNDDPFPTTNDVGFLPYFPYLAPPQ